MQSRAYARSNKLKLNFDFVCFGGENFSKTEEELFRSLSLDRSKIHYFKGDQFRFKLFLPKGSNIYFPFIVRGIWYTTFRSNEYGMPSHV